MIDTFKSAIKDIRGGFKLRSVWLALAEENITDQHRRTTLGPLWLLVNYLLFIGAFVIVFGNSSAVADYPAYVAIGFLVWNYISDTINMSATLFVREEGFIKGTKLPLSVYVLRLTTELITRAGYTLAGCLVVLPFTATTLSSSWLWSGLAICLILIATPAVVIIVAFGGAFFPDLTLILSNVMRLGLFLTPIFWVHGGEAGVRGAIYNWNPFTHFLEIVRMPILVGEMPTASLAISLTICGAAWIIALYLLGALRKQVVHVL